MGMLRTDNGRRLVASITIQREMEVMRFTGIRNGGAKPPLRALAVLPPLHEDYPSQRQVSLDVSMRGRGYSWSMGRIPIRQEWEGFLVIAAQQSHLLSGTGRDIEFTRFTEDVIQGSETIVALIRNTQKKPVLVAQFLNPASNRGIDQWTALDEKGRTFGKLALDGDPLALERDLSRRNGYSPSGMERVELALRTHQAQQ